VSDFTFRLRFRLPEGERLGIDAPICDLGVVGIPSPLTLASASSNINIGETGELVLRGSGFHSEEEAFRLGQRSYDALMLSLARLAMGAEFGTRRPQAVITSAGLALCSAATGRRFLQDWIGLTVFETEPVPAFRSSHMKATAICGGDSFVRDFTFASAQSYDMTERERLAFELYNASHFEQTSHTRFLLLVMAVEALLEPAPRSEAARSHVGGLIAQTETSPHLTPAERDSIRGSLTWLLNESIGQASKRLASSRLGEKRYDGQPAGAFFAECYSMRSRMVHGDEQQPRLAEVIGASATLKQFVSDLLTAPVFDRAV
jgi:hypothetical protein